MAGYFKWAFDECPRRTLTSRTMELTDTFNDHGIETDYIWNLHSPWVTLREPTQSCPRCLQISTIVQSAGCWRNTCGGNNLTCTSALLQLNFHPPWLLAHRRKRTRGQFSVAMKERLQVCSTWATAPSSPTESDRDFCFSFSEHIRNRRSLLLVTLSHLPNWKKAKLKY